MAHVCILNQQSSLKFLETPLQALVESVLSEEGQSCDELALHFVETAEICRLHADFFNDPSTTDCISFPIDIDSEMGDEYRVLGEVFVCPETAINYAKEHNSNPYEELTLYVVHGLLHLLAYDDIEDEDRVLMREAETRNMNRLRRLGLILSPPLIQTKEASCI